MQAISAYRTPLLLLLILTTGAVLRFYNFAELSFSNDELSALLRLQYNDLSSLINEGIRPDGHPAFTQLTLWLSGKWFGFDEGGLRLFPVLFSTLGLLFIYLTGKRMFNASVGLLAAAGFCGLEFALTYGQLARPYAFGVCFVPMFAYAWHLVLYSNRRRWLNSLFFGVAAALCMYTHYFAFLNALIIGFSGLFLLRRDNWKYYITGSLLAVLFFSPHFGILFDQMAVGGVGGPAGWLAAPTGAFFKDYLFYGFNSSPWIALLFVATAILCYFLQKEERDTPMQPLIFVWFLAPFLIGFLYSVYFNPVLQFSTLLFSFPFLLLGIFSFTGTAKSGWKITIPVVLLLGGTTYHTIGVKNYYGQHHFGSFKQVGDAFVEFSATYDDVTYSANVNNPFYINYYVERGGGIVNFSTTRIDNQPGDLRAFVDIVQNANSTYFAHGYAGKYNAEETWDVIHHYFPNIEREEQLFNAGVMLAKKGEPSIRYAPAQSFTFDDSGSADAHWKYNQEQLTNEGYRFEGLEFGLSFEATVAELQLQQEMRVRAYCDVTNLTGDAQLVMAVSRENEIIDYHGYPMDYFVEKTSENTGRVFLNRILKTPLEPKDVLKVYVWNPAKQPVYIQKLTVEIIE